MSLARPSETSKLVWLGFILSVLAIIAGYLGEYWLPLDLFSHFRIHFFASLAICALLLFIRRGVIFLTIILMAIPLSIGAYASLARMWQPKPELKTPREKIISLVSFNIWHGNKTWRPIAKYLSEKSPDFIFFMEFDHTKLKLLNRLKKQYPYHRQCITGRHCHIALLSKHRIMKSGINPGKAGGRPFIWVQLGPKFNHLTLVATHLVRLPHLKAQFSGLRDLAKFTRKRKGPLIIAGDFNATPYSFIFKDFSQRSGLEAVTGRFPTWPVRYANLPQLSIDHIFVSPSIKAHMIETGPRLGSDHLPIYGQLKLGSKP